jgi:hypothetical protein
MLPQVQNIYAVKSDNDLKSSWTLGISRLTDGSQVCGSVFLRCVFDIFLLQEK